LHTLRQAIYKKKQPELEGKMFSFFAWISFSSMSLRAGGSLEKKTGGFIKPRPRRSAWQSPTRLMKSNLQESEINERARRR
jgi:hypothetical protein